MFQKFIIAASLGAVSSCHPSFSREETQMPHDKSWDVSSSVFVGGKSLADVFPNPELAGLVHAACVGDPVGMSRAIDSGVDPNETGLDGVTPLVWVQHCENLQGVESLLDAGANPNATFFECSSAAVCFAASMSDSRFLKLLLKRGGDPDAAFENSNTALWYAFNTGLDHRGWKNYYALLDAGANINRIHRGSTIAEFAVNMNSFDKVAELLQRGYATRLDYLGWQTQEHTFMDSPEFLPPKIAARQRVIHMLKERGIAFPIPQIPSSAPNLGVAPQ